MHKAHEHFHNAVEYIVHNKNVVIPFKWENKEKAVEEVNKIKLFMEEFTVKGFFALYRPDWISDQEKLEVFKNFLNELPNEIRSRPDRSVFPAHVIPVLKDIFDIIEPFFRSEIHSLTLNLSEKVHLYIVFGNGAEAENYEKISNEIYSVSSENCEILDLLTSRLQNDDADHVFLTLDYIVHGNNLLKSTPNIVLLSLLDCKFDSTLCQILNGLTLTKLRHLVLGNFKRTKDSELIMKKLSKRNQLTGFSLYTNENEPFDDMIDLICKMTALHSLQISMNFSIENGLPKIANNLKSLREFKIVSNAVIQTSQIIGFVRTVKSLVFLSLDAPWTGQEEWATLYDILSTIRNSINEPVRLEVIIYRALHTVNIPGLYVSMHFIRDR